MSYRAVSLLFLLLLIFGSERIYSLDDPSTEKGAEKEVLDSVVDEDLDDDEISDVFIPTHEWQEIRKGQSVPAGLHYRINLQTGRKEAKLLEKEEGKERTSEESDSSRKDIRNDKKTDVQVSESSDFYGHSDRRGVINKSTKLFTRAELREMLKKIKDDSPSDDIVPLLTSTPHKEGETESPGVTINRQETGGQAPLNELKELLTFHVDVQIMLVKLQTLVNPNSTPDQLVSALEELEYYVHQIDNGRDFDILGGLTVVVRLLNYTEDYRVQSAAALVLGAATQGNPSVQELAISYGALPTLLSLLSPTTSNELLLRRVLYALGSLMRGQPNTVQSFIELKGIDKLSHLAEDSNRVESVFVKVIVLLTDLLSVEGLQETTGISVSSLQSMLSSSGWCQHTSHFLQSTVNPVAIEKCVLLMERLLPTCDYTQQYTLLRNISKRWSRIDQEKELMDAVKNMLMEIKSDNHDSTKEEL